MAARPPTNGSSDDVESVEFGIAAVDAILKASDLSFPADQDDIQTELGGRTVPFDVYGNEVALVEVVNEAEPSRFDTRQELLNALHPVFERYRERHSGGFVHQLKAMLPF